MYRVTIQRCPGSLPQAHIDRQAPHLRLVFNRACSLLELARQRTRASAVEVHLVPEQRQPNPTDHEQRSCRSGECYKGNGSFDYIRAHILALLPTPKLRQDRARNYCPKGHCPNGHRGRDGWQGRRPVRWLADRQGFNDAALPFRRERISYDSTLA